MLLWWEARKRASYIFYNGQLLLVRLWLSKKSQNCHHISMTINTMSRRNDVSFTTNSDSTKLWHMWLGHMSQKGMTVLCNKGIPKDTRIGNLGFNEHYVFWKQTRVSFDLVVHRAKGNLDYIHFNLWGPSSDI